MRTSVRMSKLRKGIFQVGAYQPVIIRLLDEFSRQAVIIKRPDTRRWHKANWSYSCLCARHNMKSEWRYSSSYSYLGTRWMWTVSRPSRCTTERESWYPLNRRLGEPLGRSARTWYKIYNYPDSFFSVAQQPFSGLGRLTVEVSRSRTIRNMYPVGLLWSSDHTTHNKQNDDHL